MRPKTKEELVSASIESYNKLKESIDELPLPIQEADFDFHPEFLEKQKETHWKRDKNIRDLLIHLYEWQQMLLRWVNANENGKEQPFLPEPYNWRTYGQLNKEFVSKHQATHLSEAKNLLEASHKETMKLLQNQSSETLFTKGAQAYTGTSTLGSYFVSSLSSHYEWAVKKLKKIKKQREK